MIRDTVFLDTPDIRAMSLIVATLPFGRPGIPSSGILRAGIAVNQ